MVIVTDSVSDASPSLTDTGYVNVRLSPSSKNCVLSVFSSNVQLPLASSVNVPNSDADTLFAASVAASSSDTLAVPVLVQLRLVSSLSLADTLPLRVVVLTTPSTSTPSSVMLPVSA